eukprot:740875_1
MGQQFSRNSYLESNSEAARKKSENSFQYAVGFKSLSSDAEWLRLAVTGDIFSKVLPVSVTNSADDPAILDISCTLCLRTGHYFTQCPLRGMNSMGAASSTESPAENTALSSAEASLMEGLVDDESVRKLSIARLSADLADQTAHESPPARRLREVLRVLAVAQSALVRARSQAKERMAPHCEEEGKENFDQKLTKADRAVSSLYVDFMKSVIESGIPPESPLTKGFLAAIENLLRNLPPLMLRSGRSSKEWIDSVVTWLSRVAEASPVGPDAVRLLLKILLQTGSAKLAMQIVKLIGNLREPDLSDGRSLAEIIEFHDFSVSIGKIRPTLELTAFLTEKSPLYLGNLKFLYPNRKKKESDGVDKRDSISGRGDLRANPMAWAFRGRGGRHQRSCKKLPLVSESDRNGQEYECGIACDGTYLYLHCEDGLAKIGSGYRGTTAAKVYRIIPSFRTSAERRWICCVETSGGPVLCFRSSKTGKTVILIDCETLHESGEAFLPDELDGWTIGAMTSCGSNVFVVCSRDNPQTSELDGKQTALDICVFTLDCNFRILERKCLSPLEKDAPRSQRACTFCHRFFSTGAMVTCLTCKRYKGSHKNKKHSKSSKSARFAAPADPWLHPLYRGGGPQRGGVSATKPPKRKGHHESWCEDCHAKGMFPDGHTDSHHILPTEPKKLEIEDFSLWLQPTIEGDLPSDRWGHSSTVVGRRAFWFGGASGLVQSYSGHAPQIDAVFNDLYILDTENSSVSQPKVKGSCPSPRCGHSATLVDGSRIFIFGGGKDDSGHNSFNDLHILDTDSLTWSSPTTTGPSPSSRIFHSATLIGRKVYVFGGKNQSGNAHDDVFMLDVDSLEWTILKTKGNAPKRWGHIAISKNDVEILFIGGSTQGGAISRETVTLKLENLEWKKEVGAESIDSTTCGSSWGVAEDGKVWIYGGFCAGQYSGACSIFDPETMRFKSVQTCKGHPPSQLSFASGNMIGDKLFIFGGYDTSDRTGSLGKLHVLCRATDPFIPLSTQCIREASFLTNGSQLACVMPPLMAPNVVAQSAMARVFALDSGDHFGDTCLAPAAERAAFCYDAENNIVWGYSRLNNTISRWANLSPPPHIIDKPDTIDDLSESQQPFSDLLNCRPDLILKSLNIKMDDSSQSFSQQRDLLQMSLLAQIARFSSSYSEKDCVPEVAKCLQNELFCVEVSAGIFSILSDLLDHHFPIVQDLLRSHLTKEDLSDSSSLASLYCIQVCLELAKLNIRRLRLQQFPGNKKNEYSADLPNSMGRLFSRLSRMYSDIPTPILSSRSLLLRKVSLECLAFGIDFFHQDHLERSKWFRRSLEDLLTQRNDPSSQQMLKTLIDTVSENPGASFIVCPPCEEEGFGTLSLRAVSTDGGIDGAKDGIYRLSNMLKDNELCYSTEKICDVNVLLESTSVGALMTVRSVVVKGPQFSFTAPIGRGLIFLLNSPDEVKLTEKFNGFTTKDWRAFLLKRNAEEDPLEPVAFFDLNKKPRKTVKIDSKRSARYILVKLIAAQQLRTGISATELGSNIDVQYVGFQGSVNDSSKTDSLRVAECRQYGLDLTKYLVDMSFEVFSEYSACLAEGRESSGALSLMKSLNSCLSTFQSGLVSRSVHCNSISAPTSQLMLKYVELFASSCTRICQSLADLAAKSEVKLKLLDASLVRVLLPTLITSLCSFVESVEFATIVLPKATELLKCIGKMALSMTVKDKQHWLSFSEHALGSFCGRCVATLVAGVTASDVVQQSQKFKRWLESPLFNEGLSPDAVLNLLDNPSSVMQSEESMSAWRHWENPELLNARASQPELKNMRVFAFAFCGGDMSTCRRVDDVAPAPFSESDDGGAALLASLPCPSERFVVRTLKSRSHPAVDLALRFVKVCLLHHNSLMDEAMEFARTAAELAKMDPTMSPASLGEQMPSSLVKVWETAGSIREWMVQERQRLFVQGNDAKIISKDKSPISSETKESEEKSAEPIVIEESKTQDSESKTQDSEPKIHDSESKISDSESKIPDSELKIPDSESKVQEPEQTDLYEKIAYRIIDKCKFLMCVQSCMLNVSKVVNSPEDTLKVKPKRLRLVRSISEVSADEST